MQAKNQAPIKGVRCAVPPFKPARATIEGRAGILPAICLHPRALVLSGKMPDLPA